MISLAKPILSEEEIIEVEKVLRSGLIASGVVVENFEKAFASYIGVPYAIATSNGTTALHTALLALGCKQGDKILTTPFTFIASSNSIRMCNAIPVFGDIDPSTFNLDPDVARKLLKKDPSIRAILLVHLYGLPCDMDAFNSLKKEFGIELIEDCAQAHGALYNQKKVGSLGDVSAFSFYATKNMTTGEGGMVLTRSEVIYQLGKKIINHGRAGQYHHDIMGYNFRLTNIAAAIGLVQLKKLDRNNARRNHIAEYYNQTLKSLDWLTLPTNPKDRSHVFHQYTLQSHHRDELKLFLEKKNIQSAIVYPLPNCQQPTYEGFCKSIDPKTPHCPHASNAAKKVLSLPVHPGLTDTEVNEVVEAIQSFQPR
jgi:dTDP-4-amino-4,6-dideoxygalactose transaminase